MKVNGDLAADPKNPFTELDSSRTSVPICLALVRIQADAVHHSRLQQGLETTPQGAKHRSMKEIGFAKHA